MADIANLNLRIGADVSAATAGLNQVQKGLASTALAASKVDSSLQKTSQLIGAASQSFIDLGRVLQDAPYGFIGIANNLNPLLEGFQRLSVQSAQAGVSIGSTLLASLKGPGGLGLALSAVTAAVTFASIGFQAWTGKVKDSADGVDLAAEKAKKLKDAIEGINNASAKELTKVKELVSGFQEENASRNDKINILNELKKINPEYFGQLSVEKTTIDELKVAYDKYNGSIQNTIKAKVLNQQLETLVQDELKLRDVLEFNNKLLDLRKGFKLKDRGGTDPGVEQQGAKLVGIQNDINANLKKQDELINKINDLGGVQAIFNFSAPKAEAAKKAIDEIYIALKKLPIVLAPTSVPDFTKPIQRILDKGPGLTVPLNFGFDKDMKKKVEDVANIITDTLSNAFVGLGETVGKGGNIFAGIFQVIGEGLKSLGKYLITSSILIANVKKALNAALLTPGGQFLAVGLGVSLIAIGSLIEKNIPKLAAGGIVTRPTNALIGESGPEAVIPLGRMQGLLANNETSGRVVFEIHGRVIRGVLMREERSAGRNE